MRKFNYEQISRGIRCTVPGIMQCEVWRHWESLTNPDNDSVTQVSMKPHVFMKNLQTIKFRQSNKVRNVPTPDAMTAELVITYFDGEATMMLQSEAEEIFGHLLPEYLEEQKKEGMR